MGKMSVKLLYIHDVSPEEGVANMFQVLHMCCAFAENGVDVKLAVPGKPHDGSRILQAIAGELGRQASFAVQTYRRITVGGRLSMVGGCPGVRQLVRNEDADICFLRNPVYLDIALRNRRRAIFESHDPVIHDNAIWNAWWTRNLLKNAHRDLLVKFVAISHRLAGVWIDRGVPSDKVLALHDGVDAAVYESPPDKEAERERLGLPPAERIVMYTGTLIANRGIERVLDLARCFTKTRFVIVGGPQHRAEYYIEQAQQRSIRNITIVGPVPHCEVGNYLAAADVLLMIWSRKVRTIDYCSPMKMFEYMAAGRIIVGDGFPTIREVLTHGESALLADPDSLDDLKTRLAEALDSEDACRIASNARHLALEQYSWKARAGAILASLRDLGAQTSE